MQEAAGDGPPWPKPTAARWRVHQQRSDPTPINPSLADPSWSSGESRANRQQVSCPSALIMHRHPIIFPSALIVWDRGCIEALSYLTPQKGLRSWLDSLTPGLLARLHCGSIHGLSKSVCSFQTPCKRTDPACHTWEHMKRLAWWGTPGQKVNGFQDVWWQNTRTFSSFFIVFKTLQVNVSRTRQELVLVIFVHKIKRKDKEIMFCINKTITTTVFFLKSEKSLILMRK